MLAEFIPPQFLGVRASRPSSSEHDGVIRLLKTHTENEMASRIRDLEAGATNPTSGSEDIAALVRLEALEPLSSRRSQVLMDFIKSGQSAHVAPVTANVEAGCRVFPAPYDLFWAGGDATVPGELWGAKDTLAILGFEGTSTYGLGTVLEAETDLWAQITPMGTYRFTFLSPYASRTRTIATLGMVLYELGQNVPLAQTSVELWSRSGWSGFISTPGTGFLTDLASPALPFGPVPFVPLNVQLKAGVRYVAWLWGSVWVHFPDQEDLLAIVTVRVPMIKVCAGRPSRIN